MTRIMNLINRLHRGESGQDVIEYALISALISVAVIGVILATGFVAPSATGPTKSAKP